MAGSINNGGGGGGARMADMGVKWSNLLIDFAVLGSVAAGAISLRKLFHPFRRGFFCDDESIRYVANPNPTFNSKSLAAICGLILLIFVTCVTPTRRGLYCDDETIKYPRHDSTIPNYLLYIYGFTIPFVLIIVTEVFVHRRSRGSGRFICTNAPVWILSLYRTMVDFCFGMACCQLVTDIGKYSIGRLRPNFISVCGPDIDFSNCAKYNGSYILNYKCTLSEHDANESRVSFPSGHSSFSAYTMLYCAIYIQMKWWSTSRRSVLRMLKHGVQVILLLLAYFTAVSRVMDNKHHWSDVTAGGLIGVISASLTAKYVARLGAKSTSDGSSRKDSEFEGITIDEENGRPKDQSVIRPV